MHAPIRLANEEDLNAVIDLQHKWRHNVGYLARSAHADHIRRRDTWLIHENDEPAGYVVAHHARTSLTNIIQVAVHPDLLRTTLGTQLMTAIAMDARKRSQLGIHLRTRLDLPANEVWPTLGYRWVGHARAPNKKRSLVNWWTLPLATSGY